MTTPFTDAKSYDNAKLYQLKEAYYIALGIEITARESPNRVPVEPLIVARQAAEDALIDFIEELLSDDPKMQMLIRQRRLDTKKQLVELILRLSIK